MNYKGIKRLCLGSPPRPGPRWPAECKSQSPALCTLIQIIAVCTHPQLISGHGKVYLVLLTSPGQSFHNLVELRYLPLFLLLLLNIQILSPWFFFFFFKWELFIYLFMAVLGLRFCARAFSSCGERGPLFIAVHGPLTIAASLVAEHGLQTRRLSSCGAWA